MPANSPMHLPYSPQSVPVPLPPPTTPIGCPPMQTQLQMQQMQMQQMQPYNPCPCAPVPLQPLQPALVPPCLSCPHNMQVPHAPPPPEVRLADQTGTALAVTWQGIGSLAANYIVQLLDRDSSVVERFVRPATEPVGMLELFIGGLIPNRCYTACVSSVAHDGCESAPSGWSAWLTMQTVACLLPHCGFQVPT